MTTSGPRASSAFWRPARTLARLFEIRGLVWQFAKRDLAEKYRGSSLGALWAVATPVLTLATYTFVFNVVLKVRWGAAEGQGVFQYALALFCGLLVYSVASECAVTAPHLVVNRRAYVKQTAFPLEALPVIAAVSMLVRTGIGLGVLMTAAVLSGADIGLNAVYIFVVLVPVVLLTLGFGWFLAALGVFVRDAAHAVTLAAHLLFFMTPIVYPVSAVPERLRLLISLNPFTHLVEAARCALLWNRAPEWLPLAAVTLVAIAVFQGGFAFFERTKRSFADVL